MAEKKNEPTEEEKVALRQANVQTVLLKNLLNINKKYGARTYNQIISYQGDPSALVSTISNPREAGCFLAGTSAELSLLTPSLTFWWVKGTEKHEFLFSDHVDGQKMIDLAKSRLEGGDMVLKNRSTIGTDVGIQEFTWMFDNKHSGDKTLKASVTIYFGSVRELLNEEYLRFIFTQNTIEEAVKQKDKDKGKEKSDAKKALDERFKALKFMFNPTTAINATKDEEESNYTQIKAVVGWSIPDIKGEHSLVSEEFKKGIASTQKTIMLNFTKYDLTFGEQGQVKLKIEYVGSLDAVMIDDEKSDIFAGVIKGNNTKSDGMTVIPKAINYEPHWAYGTNPKDKLIDDAHPKGALKMLINRGREKDELTGGDGFKYAIPIARYERDTLRMQKQFTRTHGPETKAKKIIEECDEGITAVDIAESMVLAKIARQKHEVFLTSIYESGRMRFAQVKNKIYDEGEKKPKGDYEFKMSGKDQKVSAGVRSLWKENAKANAVASAKEKSGQNKAFVGSSDPAALDPQATGGKGNWTPGVVNIYFFSLGDLIDVALKTNTFLRSEQLDARIILGTFNAGAAGIPSGAKDQIPIANIPLNIEWFSQWFTDNFINADPPRFQMSIREFINKVLEELVAPLMNDAFSTPQKTARISFSMTTASFPKTSGTIARGSTIGAAALARAAEAGKNSLTDALRTEVHYFIAFATIQDPKSLKGNYQEDVEKGIYHLFLGSERGLVKKFNFQEKKMPHIRAMHIENNSPGSALILPQDVELTMVGNTFFRNGQLVYIDADFALGKSVASKLGIGGYYLVVKSENVINSSKFETKLTCMFQQGPS